MIDLIDTKRRGRGVGIDPVVGGNILQMTSGNEVVKVPVGFQRKVRGDTRGGILMTDLSRLVCRLKMYRSLVRNGRFMF